MLLLGLMLLLSLASAETYFALPGYAREEEGTVAFDYSGSRYTYTPGLGWTGLPTSLSPPRLERGQLYVQGDVLETLGVTLPQLLGVRSSSLGTVRLVFDFAGLEADALESLRSAGQFSAAKPLSLALPRTLLPLDLPRTLEGISLSAQDVSSATLLTLSGPGGTYNVFPLGNPTRLVIDLTEAPETAVTPPPAATTPEAASPTDDAQLDARENLLSRLSPPREETRELADGVTQRAFSFRTLAGTSQVDLIEIAPGHGAFAVEGGSYDLRPPSELTGTALVGINASYFDPGGGRSIGLLKRRGVLESLPSRNRAAVGFGFGAPLIARLGGTLELTLKGRNGTHSLRLPLETERVTLHTEAGALVSSPRQGAIVVAATGRVLENKVGPRRVPTGGFVLSYLPDVRNLARVNAGDLLDFSLATTPESWRFVPEAVEAGPLLVAEGKSAYHPELEAFDTEDAESNINRRTTRAALGVRSDGTVLLLVATQLTAAELVPLFLELRAENALQLDSGGSSTLVVAGAVVNRPALLQRRVATVIRYIPDPDTLGVGASSAAETPSGTR